MSYTFINTKKREHINHSPLSELLVGLPEQLSSELYTLNALSKQTINDHIQFYIKVINALKDQKKKQQLYYLLSYILSRIENETQTLQNYFKILNVIPQSTLFKVKMYSQLFKTVNNKSLQKNILIESIRLLSQQKKLNYLTSFLHDIDSLLTHLHLNASQLSSVYIQIIRSVKQNPFYKQLAIKFIIKFLQIVSDFNTYGSSVDQFLIYLIRNAIIEQKIVVVAQSANLKPIQNNLTFQLFKIYLSGNYEDYIQLQKNNSEAINNLGINVEDYIQKLKVHYIATIAQNHKIISYDELAAKLHIKKQQVEKYIIYAIQKSVISASIDQFDQIVTIKEIKSKYFSQSQWPKIKGDVQDLIVKLKKYLQ